MNQPSIPELGHFALALAVAIGFAQASLPIYGAWRRDPRLIAAAPALAIGQMIALATAFGCLVWSSVTDDFSVLNVAENSHSLKPMLYKITGAWGNHEGSILLWCLILALCGGAVAIFGSNLPAALRARVIGVLGLSSVGFELFALTSSDPFTRLWPPPVDGRDMNPLLQDPGLASHPPILYIGYVGFAVPFAFAVAALLEGRVDAAWGRWVRPWTLAAWCCLTGGIALGSWWAYYELGWGGFWFWDPVENASPAAVADRHRTAALRARGGETRGAEGVDRAAGHRHLLAQPVRHLPGALRHPELRAFLCPPIPTRGVFILGLLGLVIGGSLLLFALRAPGAVRIPGIFAPISREGGIVLNNILLCSIAAVVMTGTTFPLFADLLLGTRRFSVGAAVLQLDRIAARRAGVRCSCRSARHCCPGNARRLWPALSQIVVGGARWHSRWACSPRPAAKAAAGDGVRLRPPG